MDFTLTEQQLEFQDAARQFARKKLAGDQVSPRGPSALDRDRWQDCATFGVQGLSFPEEYGGGQADALTVCGVFEALGQECGDSGLLFSLNAHIWACAYPLFRFGDDEQRKRWLPGLVSGELVGAHAATESEAGSDISAVSAQLTPDGSGGYRLTGTKSFVTNAPEADLFLVLARSPVKGPQRLSAVLVDRDRKGVTVGAPLDTLGGGSATAAEVVFADCPVGASDVLRSPTAGWMVFNAAMRAERTFILAGTVGQMGRSLNRCIAYCRQRRQFGQPIGSFQAVSHRLAEMKVRTEAARLMAYHAAWAFDHSPDSALHAAIAKLFISENSLSSEIDAVQVHGSAAYVHSAGFGTAVLDAIGSRIYSGTSEMQRNFIAASMGIL